MLLSPLSPSPAPLPPPPPPPRLLLPLQLPPPLLVLVLLLPPLLLVLLLQLLELLLPLLLLDRGAYGHEPGRERGHRRGGRGGGRRGGGGFSEAGPHSEDTRGRKRTAGGQGCKAGAQGRAGYSNEYVLRHRQRTDRCSALNGPVRANHAEPVTVGLLNQPSALEVSRARAPDPIAQQEPTAFVAHVARIVVLVRIALAPIVFISVLPLPVLHLLVRVAAGTAPSRAQRPCGLRPPATSAGGAPLLPRCCPAAVAPCCRRHFKANEGRHFKAKKSMRV
jgi:hypothetical protein